MKTLTTWELEAAKLVQPALDLIDIDTVAVGARAMAAATLRELLTGREKIADDIERARASMRPDSFAASGFSVEAQQRLCTAIRALIDVIDAGGACTAEIAETLAGRVLGELRLQTRWPCPECGRTGPDAPLRTLRRQAVDPASHMILPNAPVLYTGCWRCNEGDRLVALAERAP